MKRLEDEPEEGTEQRISCMVTVRAPVVGAPAGTVATETFRALVRTRLTWRGRPAIFARDADA